MCRFDFAVTCDFPDLNPVKISLDGSCKSGVDFDSRSILQPAMQDDEDWAPTKKALEKKFAEGKSCGGSFRVYRAPSQYQTEFKKGKVVTKVWKNYMNGIRSGIDIGVWANELTWATTNTGGMYAANFKVHDRDTDVEIVRTALPPDISTFLTMFHFYEVVSVPDASFPPPRAQEKKSNKIVSVVHLIIRNDGEQGHTSTWDVRDSRVRLRTAAAFTDYTGKRWTLTAKDLDVETKGSLTHKIHILFRTPEDRIGVAVQGACSPLFRITLSVWTTFPIVYGICMA